MSTDINNDAKKAVKGIRKSLKAGIHPELKDIAICLGVVEAYLDWTKEEK